MGSHVDQRQKLMAIIVISIVLIVVVLIIAMVQRRKSPRKKSMRKVNLEQSSSSSTADSDESGSRGPSFSIDEFRAKAGHFRELSEKVGKGSGALSKPYTLQPSMWVEGHHPHSSSSSSSSFSSPDVECKSGGIGTYCRENEDCACGLKCQGGTCTCPKPPPPNIRINTNTNAITVTWSPVAGADFYDIYLFNQSGVAYAIQLFFTGTVITFYNLPAGSYYVIVFSGSDQCGSLQQFTQSEMIQVGGCARNSDCPSNTPVCNNGICTGCTTNADCPSGQHCSANQCTSTCASTADCPQGYSCLNGGCQICPVPVVTGVTVTGSWPNPIQFQFQVSGGDSSGNTITFSYDATGSLGATAVSGYLPPFLLANNLWPTVPTGDFPSNDLCTPNFPCCAYFNFGCPQSGCTSSPAPNVAIKFTNVIATNSCGQSSAPTCWTFSSLCPGSTATASPC